MDKEKELARHRAYYWAHRDEIRKKEKEYRDKNREEINRKRRETYPQNRERICERQRNYYRRTHERTKVQPQETDNEVLSACIYCAFLKGRTCMDKNSGVHGKVVIGTGAVPVEGCEYKDAMVKEGDE